MTADATSGHADPSGHATALARTNFGVAERPFPLPVVHALARIKMAWAVTNAEAGVIDADVAAAVASAAGDVADGLWDQVLDVDLLQTGSGTSSNMNVNEVVATLATRRLTRDVHPNDVVNASQSSNDTVPTAIRVAALTAIRDVLVPGLRALQDALTDRSMAFADVVKAGRTHLMDASPITLGQELAGHAAQVAEAIERIESSQQRLAAVPLGGTATGNGLNCPPGAAVRAVAELARLSGLPLRPAANAMALQGGQDALVEMSGQVRAAALACHKIANDIRLLASGPATGLGEITLPELQPGSSIMPGKVNPVLCEVVTQVAARVMGTDATVAFAGAQGTLELNTYLPVMADALLESIVIVGRAADDFARRCVAGIEADVERCRALAEATPSAATGLNLVVGYDEATRIVRRAADERTTVRAILTVEGALSPQEIDAALDVDTLARGTPIL